MAAHCPGMSNYTLSNTMSEPYSKPSPGVITQIFHFGPAAAGGLAILMVMGYCLQNTSGHSGMDFSLGVLFFAPIAAHGLCIWYAYHRVQLGISTLLIGLLGALFCLMVHPFGIMLQYESWIASGMPNQNAHTSLIIATFGVVSLASIALTIWRFGRTDRDVLEDTDRVSS